MNTMYLQFIPYLFLALSLLTIWVLKKRNIFLLVFAISLIVGYLYNVLSAISILAILIFFGLAILALFLGKIKSYKLVYYLLCSLIFILSLLFFSHKIPGFNNLLIFNKVQISQDGIPFTMYLNFDKIVIGIILLFLFVPVVRNIQQIITAFKNSFLLIILTICILIGLSIVFSFVKFDFKVGSYLLIWGLNNLFFVCMAEEVLFRGFLQNQLMSAIKIKYKEIIAIIVPAMIFGLLHYSGGYLYVILSIIAGLMYGIIYYRSKSIEMTILAHFLVNLAHIIFFTYPLLRM